MTEGKKPKGKIGRPSKITAELEAKLWAAIADGSSTRQACAQCGISYQSVAVKLAADAAFRDRRARAYLHGTVFYLDNAEEGLRTATSENINVRREIAHHARWRAGRMLPAFSDKLNIAAEVTTAASPKTAEEYTELSKRLMEVFRRSTQALPDPGRVLPHEHQAHVDAEFVPSLPAYPLPKQAAPTAAPAKPAEPQPDDDCDVF